MPPKNKSKATQPAQPDAAASEAAPATPPAAVEPEDAGGAVTGDDDPTAEEAPLNRAERRAKGKGTGQPQPTSRGKVVGGKGPASSQRMWANRRSG